MKRRCRMVPSFCLHNFCGSVWNRRRLCREKFGTNFLKVKTVRWTVFRESVDGAFVYHDGNRRGGCFMNNNANSLHHNKHIRSYLMVPSFLFFLKQCVFILLFDIRIHCIVFSVLTCYNYRIRIYVLGECYEVILYDLRIVDIVLIIVMAMQICIGRSRRR